MLINVQCPTVRNSQRWPAATVICLVFLLAAAGFAQQPKRRVAHEGVAVEMEIEPVAAPRAPLREGADAIFRFSITDAATGTALTGLRPAAWLDALRENEAQHCGKKIAAFLSGGLAARPALDLNTYYVLALNHDATITVVDPLFHFGGTKLLALVALKSPGHDWALTADQARLFVSLPDVNQVAVVDAVAWKVIANVDLGARPTRLALQPDEQYLWVAYDGADESGVAALTTAGLKVAARIPTGGGAHELAFSDDQRFAFVTNSAAGTTSVVDVRGLRKVKEIKTGRKPVAVAFSALGKAAYIADEEEGNIVAIDAARLEIVARVPAAPGLGPLKFAPGGRLGFAASTMRNEVYILDAATNRIIQTAAVGAQPDQISFSERLAYVRARASEFVYLIPLDQVGKAGQPVPVLDFPGGQAPLGQTARPSPAGAIVPARDPNAVIVANPADKTIYYYKEGMAAPMGNFSNYKREPRAVLVVDRSLRARAPGVYETVAKLPPPGRYEVAFILDAPRLVHCFAASIEPNPERPTNARPPRVELLTNERVIRIGAPTRLRFKLVDENTKAAKIGVKDLQAVVFLAPGLWQQRLVARETAEGIYELEFAPPETGVYYVHLSAVSQGLSANRGRLVTLEARPSN